ncbi:serine protease, partial [Chitinophaga sp.]|uniref:S1C family serine protease n=1 Tax=Chitinophaga sp. TaxID=1869181 RepID=UPI002F94A24B
MANIRTRLALFWLAGFTFQIFTITPDASGAVNEACIFKMHRTGVAKVFFRYETASDGKGTETGSGFVVSPQGHIVTNAHVLTPSAKGVAIVSSAVGVQLGSALAPEVDAKILLKSDTLDIAILKLNDPQTLNQAVPLPVSPPNMLAVGSPLIALGFPTTDVSSAVGTKSSLTALSPDVDPAWIQTSIPLNAGNSGGPVFGPMGNVIGIAIAKTKNAQLITYVLPIELITPFLQSIGIEPTGAGPCAACRHASHGVEKYT